MPEPEGEVYPNCNREETVQEEVFELEVAGIVCVGVVCRENGETMAEAVMGHQGGAQMGEATGRADIGIEE